MVEAEKVSWQWMVEVFALRCQRKSILSFDCLRILGERQGFACHCGKYPTPLLSFQPTLWIGKIQRILINTVRCVRRISYLLKCRLWILISRDWVEVHPSLPWSFAAIERRLLDIHPIPLRFHGVKDTFRGFSTSLQSRLARNVFPELIFDCFGRVKIRPSILLASFQTAKHDFRLYWIFLPRLLRCRIWIGQSIPERPFVKHPCYEKYSDLDCWNRYSTMIFLERIDGTFYIRL